MKKRLYYAVLYILTIFILAGCDSNKGKEENIKKVNDEDDNVYYIKWAVPDDSIKVQDEWIIKINDRLRSEGYPFRLQLVRIIVDNDKDYKTLTDECDADIVFTGFENYKSRFALKGMIEGKYEELTEYINESKLKSIIPEKLLKAVSYKGHIYLLPNEWGVDGANKVLVYLGNEESVRSGDFKNNIFMLRDHIDSKDKIYYGLNRFDFVRLFGYYYDAVNGIVTDRDGNIINPFESDRCLKWMNMVNEWYKAGYAPDPTKIDREIIKKQCTFHICDETDMEKEGLLAAWKTELSNRYICSTAIKNDSKNKKYAFELLELFRTDHNYGNLLIYGITEDEKTIPKETTYLNKVVFGLDDGLLQTDDAFRHFSSTEERLKYYEEEVILSPTVDMDIPFDCYELCGIINRYLLDENIMFDNEYENKLESFKKEYTAKLNEIKMVMEEKNETGM